VNPVVSVSVRKMPRLADGCRWHNSRDDFPLPPVQAPGGI